MKWLSVLFSRSDQAATARAACQSVMSAALAPPLYLNAMAEDSFDGRFEMTALFAGLAMRRLREAGADGRTLADGLYRQIFSGFDYALRETGTGDATIAKKVRGLGERFYGLARAIDAALEAPEPHEAVQSALVRNGLGGSAPKALARHVVNSRRALDAQEDALLLAGRFAWPDLPAQS